MTIARLYRMIAAEGQEEALRAALTDLATTVRAQPGNEGVEMLRDTEKPESFVFIEKWQSVAAHAACLGSLPKSALAPVMGALAQPPEGAYLDYLLTA